MVHPTHFDRIRDLRTRLSALMVDAQCLARECDPASDDLENAVSQAEEMQESLASAYAAADEAAAFADALDSGERWAVAGHRADVAAEQAEYLRRTA